MDKLWMLVGLLGAHMGFVADSGAIDVRPLISQARPSTVFITVSVVGNGTTSTHRGTGFIISADGYVLTAAHVIPQATEGQIGPIMGAKQSSAAAQEQLEFIAHDPLFDVTLLRFKNTASTYPALKLAGHAHVTPGDEILEIGFPSGLEFNSKAGRISGLGGPSGSIISDLALNPGDSGAPILNASGEVIAMVVWDLKGSQGISLLLPVTYTSTLLGIAGVSMDTATNSDTPGRFIWRLGTFLRSGNNWSEIDEHNTYSFVQTGTDSQYIYLHDDSRNMDLRFPIKGGSAAWRQGGGQWNTWEVVTPKNQ